MPVRSRRTLASASAIDTVSLRSQDLLIVGPGVLGSCLGKIWKDRHPDSAVVGETNSETNHGKLKSIGVVPRVKADADSTKYPFVVFSAPASGSEDYAGEVRRALEKWDGTGSFVFTSSAGVYDQTEGNCDETAPTLAIGANPRQDKLLLAEEAVAAAGGNVIRYVGLYHAGRGAHTYFYNQGEVKRDGAYFVNLIHYEDAADMARAVLEGSGSEQFYRSERFLGCDDTPISFADMMDACDATGAFKGKVTFTGSGGPAGKQMNSKATKARLEWQPKYNSFASFMAETGAKDWYSEELAPEGTAHQE